VPPPPNGAFYDSFENTGLRCRRTDRKSPLQATVSQRRHAHPLFGMKRPWLAFDLSSTGTLLAIVPEMRAAEQPLTVVLNWTTQMAK
jgi:hypothetical protein